MVVLGTYLSASSGLMRFCVRRSSAVSVTTVAGTEVVFRPTFCAVMTSSSSCWSVAMPWASAGTALLASERARMARTAERRPPPAAKERVRDMNVLQIDNAPGERGLASARAGTFSRDFQPPPVKPGFTSSERGRHRAPQAENETGGARLPRARGGPVAGWNWTAAAGGGTTTGTDGGSTGNTGRRAMAGWANGQ